MKPLPLRWPCLALVLMTASVVFAGDPGLRIAVRSEVDQPFKGWGKAPIEEHGKTYAIAYLKEHQSAEALVKPVAEETVYQILVTELSKRGFQAVSMDNIPDILLAVDYGRATLKNPYMKGLNMDDSSDPPVVSITGLYGKYMMDKLKPGFEEKLQNAEFEKLFVRVIAWANPRNEPPPKPGKKLKLHEVWRTVVVIDDPANRDLNLFLEKMLAAASPYFDHVTEDTEAISNTNFPEGYVHIGETKVVPDRAGDRKDGR